MTLGGCPHEKELSRLLEAGHWPQAAGSDLRAHVVSCRSCADLALVRTAFASDRARQLPLARLEAPGVLWWRAQLRRRQAALQQINRPLLGAQIFAALVTGCAAVAFLLLRAERAAAWLTLLGELPRFLHLDAVLPGELQNSAAALWGVLFATLTLAIAGGIFVYIKSEKP